LFAEFDNLRGTLSGASGLPRSDVAWLGKFPRRLEVASSVPYKPLTLGDALSRKTFAQRYNISPRKNRKLKLVRREFAVEEATFEVWRK